MARPVGKRYDHPFDGDAPRVTPSRIRRLSREAQVQLIAQWFYSLHEDPANETPYNGREGGYLYIHGGPYDAREAIENEFIDYVDAEIIGRAIDEVESDGTVEWAPSFLHPDRIAYDEEAIASLEPDEFDHPASTRGIFTANHALRAERNRDPVADHDQIDARLERGARTSFGTSYDRAVRLTVQSYAADLRALLSKAETKPVKHGGIGHNQPPSDIELEEEQKVGLKAAVEAISEELVHERPDVRKVSRAARVLQSIGRWVAKKLDISLEAFLKGMFGALGISAAGTLTAVGIYGVDAIIHQTMALYHSVIDWLNAVVLPF
ncbi:hypothetical protein UF64_18710 [Thalassospira sp. HJ]|uniref:hypothetical protein n=1 Tax=Thalassospira sp. HJ TaxID=1616823 RepID=UPI0005CE2B56|nr:hypothetical protein [Thalassospira sp. HJ]KJE33740.1 hypothetical protein UF64_18710 [Thalassospira sp. HJ]